MTKSISHKAVFRVEFHFEYFGCYQEGESRRHAEVSYFEGTKQLVEMEICRRFLEMTEGTEGPITWLFENQSAKINDGGNRLIWANACTVSSVPKLQVRRL